MLWKIPLGYKMSKSHSHMAIETSQFFLYHWNIWPRRNLTGLCRSSNSNSPNGSPWKYLKSYTLIQENAFEHVCEMSAILSRPQCVKFHLTSVPPSFLFQSAIVFASDNGLKVTTEDAKCVQANAFVQTGIFSDFHISQEQATFKVNLTVLLVSSRSIKSEKVDGYDLTWNMNHWLLCQKI